MATVNSLALEMIIEQGESTDDSDYVTQVENWVKNGLVEIAVATNWVFFQGSYTLSTVAGTAVYTLPTTVREVRQIQNTTNNQPIDYWTIPEAAQAGADLTEQGTPLRWFSEGFTTSGSNVVAQVRLYPVPSDAIDLLIFYIFNPGGLSTSSVLTVPDTILVLLRDLVRERYLSKDRQWEGADRARARYEKNLADLKARENRKVADRTALAVTDLPTSRIPMARLDPSIYPA